jgi:hypothetical protein
MKTIIIALLLVSFTNTTYGQRNVTANFENENLKTEELPGMVIKTNGKILSIYLPDKHPDEVVRGLEKEFVNYTLPKIDKENPINHVSLEIERGTLMAYYNDDQKLIRVDEKYKNIRLPNTIVYSVQKELPGWAITDDTYFYSQKDGVVTKKHYKLRVEKENKMRNILVYADGQIKN